MIHSRPTTQGSNLTKHLAPLVYRGLANASKAKVSSFKLFPSFLLSSRLKQLQRETEEIGVPIPQGGNKKLLELFLEVSHVPCAAIPIEEN